MLDIIYSELLKLKRSFMFPLIAAGAIVVPTLIFMVQTNRGYGAQEMIDIIPNINIFQIQIIDILVIALMSSYVFAREFIEQTANIFYSYSFSRMKIFISKVITIAILIFILYMLNFIVINALLFWVAGIDGVKEIFMLQLKTSVISAIAQIIIVPIPILIGCISKNILFPIIYGAFGALSSMIAMLFGVYMQLSPLMLPSIPFFYFYAKEPIDTIAVGVNIIATFLIFSTLTILYFKRTDIN